MSATTFSDSTGIHLLMLACQKAAADGAELRLLLPCPHVLRVMSVLGADAVLPLYRSRDEALVPRLLPRLTAPLLSRSGTLSVAAVWISSASQGTPSGSLDRLHAELLPTLVPAHPNHREVLGKLGKGSA